MICIWFSQYHSTLSSLASLKLIIVLPSAQFVQDKGCLMGVVLIVLLSLEVD